MTDPRLKQAQILVTGATGNVGLELVKQLQEQHQPIVAAVSSAESAIRLPADTPYRVFNFGDLTTYAGAFDDVDRLFLLRPPQLADVDRYFRPLVAAALAAGVRHIVFLSLVGAERNRFVPHHKIEALLHESGIPYTFLRAGFFMQNLSTTHVADIRDYDDLFIPAGRGKTAFVDVRDLAAVATLVLTTPGHANNAYVLTGAAAHDLQSVATEMSRVLGRPIGYSRPSLPRFVWHMWRRRGYKLAHVGVMAAIYTTTRIGMAEAITTDVHNLLGRKPISIAQFIADYQAVWQPNARR